MADVLRETLPLLWTGLPKRLCHTAEFDPEKLMVLQARNSAKRWVSIPPKTYEFCQWKAMEFGAFPYCPALKHSMMQAGWFFGPISLSLWLLASVLCQPSMTDAVGARNWCPQELSVRQLFSHVLDIFGKPNRSWSMSCQACSPEGVVQNFQSSLGSHETIWGEVLCLFSRCESCIPICRHFCDLFLFV